MMDLMQEAILLGFSGGGCHGYERACLCAGIPDIL